VGASNPAAEPLVAYPAAGWAGGIWSRLLDTDRCVVDAAWRHHRGAGQHVGKCRTCGQPLKPGEPYSANGGSRLAYPTTCAGPGAHEAVAYGPRPARRKGAA
jgi:hypothetical protein